MCSWSGDEHLDHSRVIYSIGWRCCARNADGDECGFITDVRQDDYNDDMITPARWERRMWSHLRRQFHVGRGPVLKERRIRRAFIQEEMVDSSDTPTVLVEFRDSATKQVEPGEVVTIVGVFVRVRLTPSPRRTGTANSTSWRPALKAMNNPGTSLLVESVVTKSWLGPPNRLNRVGSPHKIVRSGNSRARQCEDRPDSQQCGGSENTFGLRSDIHSFIIGDPGEGKSVLVEHARDMHQHALPHRRAGHALVLLHGHVR